MYPVLISLLIASAIVLVVGVPILLVDAVVRIVAAARRRAR
ncbi:hypothetical protein [Rhodococcoides kyotonense]|nr:hypothetical protein [Rhodococcus kyotonensis]